MAGGWWRIIGVLLLALGLTSCTAVKLGYNTLAEVSYWWLDGYFDFNERQAPQVREDLARLHRWHRTNELPRYADLLSKMEHLAQTDAAPEQVCALFSEVRGHLVTLMDRAEPALTVMALESTAAQVDALQRKYAKKNAEFRREWIELPAAERRRARFKQVLERSESFYGPLDAPQRDAIRQHVERSSFDPEVSLAEQLRRQQAVLALFNRIVRNHPPLSEVRTELHRLMRDQLDSPDRAYRAYAENLQNEGCRSVAALHAVTTAPQRSKAAERLRAYASDARELAGMR